MTNPSASVLVVDDEPPMRRFLRTALVAHGYRVTEASDAREALAAAATLNPEVVLLDLGLPDLDGIAVTRAIREWSTMPIVVVSARGREEDKVAALDAGADDYLTKPFGVLELLARIRVALRHAARDPAATEPVLRVGDLRIDQERREVTVHDRPVHLTPIEYRLLVVLARNAGRVLTHRTLLREVWGDAYAEQTHSLRVFMAGLRRKIEDDPARPRFLRTELGVGYRMEDA